MHFMKAIRVHEHGGIEQLRIDEISTPKPSSEEVLLKIKAVGMNHMDLWVRKGLPGFNLPLPIILGCEASGVVEESGSKANRFKKGDDVVINPLISCGDCPACKRGEDHYCPSFGLYGETQDGFDSEYTVISEKILLPKPKSLSFEEAAAIPVTFITAWEMLVGKCKVREGQTVLVIAASSGVGTAAVQIAKLHGARVIATAGSDEKLSLARKLGADEVINHRSSDIAKEVKKMTGGRGVEIVFEHVGAATWEASLRSLAHLGKIVTCGATTGAEVKLQLTHLFIKQQQIIGSTMGPSASLKTILELTGKGKLKPVIDHIFPFSQVKEAHERLEGRGQFGKIVLRPD